MSHRALLRCLRKVMVTPEGAHDDVAGQSTRTDQVEPDRDSLIVPSLLTMSHWTEQGIPTLAAAGITADLACLSSSHETLVTQIF